MPAALLMSNLQAAVRGLSSPSLAPNLLCSRLNSIVYRNTDSDRFITFFYAQLDGADRKSTRLNSSHSQISYAVFCLKKKKKKDTTVNHGIAMLLPSITL